MNKEERREYHALFGRARKKGRNAHRMLTPFRWVRYKLTGDPLKRRERAYLDRTLYPNMVTTRRFVRVGPTNINLVSLVEKYQGEYE